MLASSNKFIVIYKDFLPPWSMRIRLGSPDIQKRKDNPRQQETDEPQLDPNLTILTMRGGTRFVTRLN